MPRKRKTQPGDGGAYANRTDMMPPAQAPAVPTGLPYGQKQALEQGQQAVPVAGDPFQQALQAAQGMEFAPVGLAESSQRPHQPIQAGLPSGPGPGPEILGATSPRTADMLDRLAAQTGNSAIAEMARRARNYGI